MSLVQEFQTKSETNRWTMNRVKLNAHCYFISEAVDNKTFRTIKKKLEDYIHHLFV